MIKGINKQIIEVKCPNNEYFDKVLLFVNSEKDNLDDKILQEQADDISENFIKNASGFEEEDNVQTGEKENYFKKNLPYILPIAVPLFIILVLFLIVV